MKILVLEGSPNRHGSSNFLAEEFIRGAREAGHTVEIIDAAHADLHPCTGCVRCGYEGPCVQKDGMEQFRRQILDADMLVFVTPPLLLRDVRPAEDPGGPVLRHQQQHHPEAHEVRPALCRLERGQLDL